jgi:phosphate starvation-inducible PhoH-like protein
MTKNLVNDKILVHGVGGKIIKDDSNQQLLVDAINKMIWFSRFSCRTGKTYTGVAMAIKALKEKQVKRIYLHGLQLKLGKSRFSSWRYEKKLDPYMQPYALRDMLPNEKIEDYILKGYQIAH